MPLNAEAAIVNEPGGGPHGQASINKVGNMLLAEGIAVLTQTTLTITASNNGQTQTVLQGNVFKTNMSGSGNVTGFVHFNGGTMLSRLQTNNHERVSKTDGSKQSLQIVSVSPQVIEAKDTSVQVHEVTGVHSPHVYSFEISAGQNPSCILRPTCNCLIRKRFVMALILVGLACAITLPIVIPLAAGGGRGNNNWRMNNSAFPAAGGGYFSPAAGGGYVSPAAGGSGGASSSGGGPGA